MIKGILSLPVCLLAILGMLVVIHPHTNICSADIVKDVSVVKTEEITLEKFPSHPENNLSKTDIFHKLRVSVSGEVEQKASTDGIRLIMSIYNDAEYDIPIKNPVDWLRISLWDNKHDLVRLPTVSLVPKIKDGRMYEEIIPPYRVKLVTLNEKILSSDEIEQRVLTISPKHKLAIEILIDKKMKYTPEDLDYKGGPLTPEQVKKGGETIPLPVGSYVVHTALSIYDPYAPIEKRRSLNFKFAVFKVNLSDKKEAQDTSKAE